MRAFHSAAAPQFPHLAQKTYAAHPVWKDSARGEVKFAPLGRNRKESRRAAADIFFHARRFERQTARTRIDAFGHIHQQGKLGRMGLLVLQALLFDFLNHGSGRLDPSYDAIAEVAIVSRASVHRALVRLKASGILSWVRRCRETMDETRYVLEQESNAYGVSPPGCWKGYTAPPEPPPPAPDSWGASPPLPPASVLAVAASRAGDRRRAAMILDGDPGDWLAQAARRLMPPGGNTV